MESSNSKKPVKVFKAKGITASIFGNLTKAGDTFYKTCLQRTWFDGENYQTSDSFGRDEIPVAVLMLQKAHEYVLETEETAKKKVSEEK